MFRGRLAVMPGGLSLCPSCDPPGKTFFGADSKIFEKAPNVFPADGANRCSAGCQANALTEQVFGLAW